jgi:hypothetical protein
MTREEVVERVSAALNSLDEYLATLDGEALTSAGDVVASVRDNLKDIAEAVPDIEYVAKSDYDKVKEAYRAMIAGREPPKVPDDVTEAVETKEETTEETDPKELEDLIYDS